MNPGRYPGVRVSDRTGRAASQSPAPGHRIMSDRKPRCQGNDVIFTGSLRPCTRQDIQCFRRITSCFTTSFE
eukprot:757577-Hanusia_phi.AAC.1